jgi:uncharacterized protein YjbI with pentapeptide repeats
LGGRTVEGLDPSAPNGRPARDGSEAAPAALPKIAEKADDLEAIKKAVDDAAAVGGGLWFSYLFVVFYLAVAAGAVTHADLFLENPVKLPFLNVELPLLAFFFLAPILFLIVHAYTLMHLVMLTDKAKRFDQALHDQIGEEDGHLEEEVARRAKIRTGLRRQLPSNIFVQFLAGPRDLRASAFGWLLRAVAWVTLVIAPILLLLMMQLQFLPFHSSFITWAQRFALLVDLVLIWWLWGKILSGREVDRVQRKWPHRIWSAAGLVLSLAVLFVAAAATFPGEWQEQHWPSWRAFASTDELGRPTKVSLHDWLFNSKVDDTTRRRWLPLSSTLVLPGFNIYEGLGIDDPDKARWHDFVFRARGRDLRGAIFDLASLTKVDFEGAQLQGASLQQASLQSASLDGAQLQGAWLQGAQFKGASLEHGQLQGAYLVRTELQGASLEEARLQGASLDEAQLQGASLKNAQLLGASLEGTQLQGASLEGAQLQGTFLAASMKATDLSNAYLWRASHGDNVDDIADIRLTSTPFDNYRWAPYQPWTDNTYGDLLQMIGFLSPGILRDVALDRIRSLDCAVPDPPEASCDPSRPPPPEDVNWQKALEGRHVDDMAYKKALAAELKRLVCSGGGNAVNVLRGLLHSGRLSATGPEAPTLVDFLTSKESKDCFVAVSLTDADKANLLSAKHHSIENCEQETGVFRRSRTFQRCVGTSR